MRLGDTVSQARAEYAAAVAPVLGRPMSEVLAVMDRELRQLRAGVESVSDRRWYASVAAGTPDYGIYDDPDYMLYLWPGTVLYARPTVNWITRHVPADRVRTVIDLGCGIGYSTALLAHAYPGAQVYGTNVEGVQAQVGRRLGVEHRFTIVPDARAVPGNGAGTLIVASEYFEHFYRPVEHLRSVLAARPKPSWLAIANAFGARSAGHFPVYAAPGPLPGKTVGRVFNAALRTAGYARVGAGWNGRPTLWGAKSV